MANEIQVQSVMTIRKGHMDESITLSFSDDMDGTPDGPCPGAVSVSTDGTDIDLTELIDPGWCAFKNLSSTYNINIGIWEPATSLFYPFIELEPGQGCIVPLSRELRSEYSGTGTGTSGYTNTLRAKAKDGAAILQVKAYER